MNLSAAIAYDPTTGTLTWLPGGRRADLTGKAAGTVRIDGRYRTLKWQGRRMYCHRIAWELVHGQIPPGLCIDHIDGDGLNNRIENLRLTTRSGNQRNKRLPKNSRTGVAGVAHASKGGFAVTCSSRYVGYSKDFNEAVALRKAAEADHGYHPNHGRKPA